MNQHLTKQCVAAFIGTSAGLIYGRFFVKESK